MVARWPLVATVGGHLWPPCGKHHPARSFLLATIPPPSVWPMAIFAAPFLSGQVIFFFVLWPQPQNFVAETKEQPQNFVDGTKEQPQNKKKALLGR